MPNQLVEEEFDCFKCYKTLDSFFFKVLYTIRELYSFTIFLCLQMKNDLHGEITNKLNIYNINK